jgi:single-stranded DNA-specific DHH superfamily exonuclease
MLVGKEHNFVLTIISKWSLKHVIRATVVFSLLINIGHCFQYRINYGWAQLLNDFDGNELTYDLYPSIVIFNAAFQVYSIAYFVINFGLFFLINTFVEASLVMKMRKEIAEKRKRIEEEIRASAANNLSFSKVVTNVIRLKQRKIVEDAKKETRAIKMVVANSLINFFLRVPEICVFFSSNTTFLNYLVFGQVYNLNSMFLFNNISSMMVSVSYFCYILTFTTNVVIYCVFNGKFKHHFAW